MSARFYQERNKVTNFNSDSQNILIYLKKKKDQNDITYTRRLLRYRQLNERAKILLFRLKSPW